YSVLLRVGFAVPQSVATCAVRSYRTISPLPAVAGGRFVFCCTFRGLTPPRRYLAPCPMEPGLSSRIAPTSCPADSRAQCLIFRARALRSFRDEDRDLAHRSAYSLFLLQPVGLDQSMDLLPHERTDDFRSAVAEALHFFERVEVVRE